MCGDRLYRVCAASEKSEYKHRAEKHCIEKVYNETAQIEIDCGSGHDQIIRIWYLSECTDLPIGAADLATI